MRSAKSFDDGLHYPKSEEVRIEHSIDSCHIIQGIRIAPLENVLSSCTHCCLFNLFITFFANASPGMQRALDEHTT